MGEGASSLVLWTCRHAHAHACRPQSTGWAESAYPPPCSWDTDMCSCRGSCRECRAAERQTCTPRSSGKSDGLPKRHRETGAQDSNKTCPRGRAGMATGPSDSVQSDTALRHGQRSSLPRLPLPWSSAWHPFPDVASLVLTPSRGWVQA